MRPDAKDTAADSSNTQAAPRWTALVPPADWEIYLSAMHALRNVSTRFMLGGAFGLAAYTGRWRNTKDIDFYILPRDRDVAVRALTEAGFEDYFAALPYDQGWIYRATRARVIVDLIWGTPNRRTEVDDPWLQRASRLLFQSELVEVVPAEELLWIKLYVLQRDRSDWPDLVNLLYATSSSLDWDHLVSRLEDDLPLLTGLLSVFAWVCPDRVSDIPTRLRKLAGVKKPGRDVREPDAHRIQLLDSRPWFAAHQPDDQPMRL